MPVRAAWQAAELVVDFDDPLATPPEPRIERVGTPIVLRAGEPAELNARLIEVIAAEAALDGQGVRCPIKNAHGTSCHACPAFQDDGSSKAKLCALGREQEVLCTRIVATHHGS